MKQELTQEEATQEQSEVASKKTIKATPEVTSPEEKITSERPRTEEEFRKIQSLKGKAENRAEKAEALVASVQSELQEFRNEIERQRKEVQQKEIDSLAEDPDAQSRLRRLYQRENDMGKAETELQDKSARMTAKWNQAFDLAKEYGVDVNELIATDSPEVMEKMAKLLSQGKVVEQAKDETSTETDVTPDSNTSDAGADSDASFQEKWNSGELPATKENIARAEKIIKK